MATSAVMTIEQYSRTSFSPDAHFVDGVIEQRAAGHLPHSRMLGLLATALDGISEDHFSCLILRIRISRARVRVCDVVLMRVDAPDEQIPSTPPTVCVEVLDIGEEPSAAGPALADYAAMGVENVWLIDIANATGYVYRDNGLHRTIDNLLLTTDGKIALQLDPLFNALDKYKNE